MELKYYTKAEVHELPLDHIQAMNKAWRVAIQEHYHLWTYELLKRNPRPFDEFLLDQEELQDLHYQFRWEKMTSEEKLLSKFSNIDNDYETTAF